MDAVVRNKGEAEALAAFLHIAHELGISVEIESSAYSEGGLREIWKFIGVSKDQLGWLLAIIVLIFSRFPVSDPEVDALNKEILKLTVEEKKANLEKLRRELGKSPPQDKKVSDAATLLESDLKVATRRSNFYRNLVPYDKVTGVGFVPIDPQSISRPDESTVSRGDFAKFIQVSDRLPVETVDEAVIEIVAPVLTEGNYQWKGRFNDLPISFAMTDESFRSSVLSRQVSFQRGSTITCVLNIHRKFNEVGEVSITGYSVVTVISKADGAKIEETVQGKRHRFERAKSKNQRTLFDPQ